MSPQLQTLSPLARTLYDALTEEDKQLNAFINFPIVNMNMTSRHTFVSTEGYIFGDWDFKNQEMVTLAVECLEQVMLEAFRQPEKKTIILPGTDTPLEYVNPAADLHTLTIAGAYPEVFAGLPEWELVNKAKTTEPGKRKSWRDIGKIINFGTVFMQTIEAMANINHVPVETATRWSKGHKETYPTFHAWAERMAKLGSARGWIETSWGGRIRWVNEDNAKAAGASPARSAVNHLIQGE